MVFTLKLQVTCWATLWFLSFWSEHCGVGWCGASLPEEKYWFHCVSSLSASANPTRTLQSQGMLDFWGVDGREMAEWGRAILYSIITWQTRQIPAAVDADSVTLISICSHPVPINPLGGFWGQGGFDSGPLSREKVVRGRWGTNRASGPLHEISLDHPPGSAAMSRVPSYRPSNAVPHCSMQHETLSFKAITFSSCAFLVLERHDISL